MKKLFAAFILLSSTLGYASAPATESYMKSVCSAAPINTTPLQPFVTYYFYIPSTQPYPNTFEIADLFPSRYEAFMSACNVDDNPMSGHWATLEYISMSSYGLRAVGEPCRMASQCTSNRCSTTTGACLAPIVITTPSK